MPCFGTPPLSFAGAVALRRQIALVLPFREFSIGVSWSVWGVSRGGMAAGTGTGGI